MLGEAVYKGAFKSFKIVVISFFFVNNNNTHCTPEKTQRISADSDFWSSDHEAYIWTLCLLFRVQFPLRASWVSLPPVYLQ